ncbi:hypothetical protein [Trinickia sp. LjRoot230]|uniref:hypothetical protein n=1 Tax=Trinickia sp. LjRoot230 TaxID=3342288 RepID=UPI003F4FE953
MSISASGGPGAARPGDGALPPHEYSARAPKESEPTATPQTDNPTLDMLRLRNTVTVDGEPWDVAARCTQWTVLTQPDQTIGSDPKRVARFRVVNLDETGRRRFYEVQSGKFGEPIVVPEPEKALPVPANVKYVHGRTGDAVTLPEKIAGIILRNEKGFTVGRFSLTNAERQGTQLSLDNSGRLEVDGKTFFLQSILMPDANRVRNYDAYFGPTRPESGNVRVWEKGYLPI